MITATIFRSETNPYYIRAEVRGSFRGIAITGHMRPLNTDLHEVSSRIVGDQLLCVRADGSGRKVPGTVCMEAVRTIMEAV